MRVLFVSHGYPPFGVAGVERITEQSATTLAARGHEITIFARRPCAAPPIPRIQRLKNKQVDVMLVSGGSPTNGTVHSAGHSTLERLFEQSILETSPDVIVIAHVLHHSPGYVLVAQKWSVPVIVELHDFYFACERAHLERTNGELCSGPEHGLACADNCFVGQVHAERALTLRTSLFRHALQSARTVVCPSQFVADYFINHFPTAPRPVVIGNSVGVDPQVQHSRVRKKRFNKLYLASVGVVVPHKGIHIVIEALRTARLDGATYIVFGAETQPYVSELRTAASGIPGLDFKVFGKFEPIDLTMLLADVDAVVIPSLVWETYSIVAHEAFACGVPVIASRIGALQEGVRDKENGLLFEPAEPSALAHILRRLAEHPDELNRLREGIRRQDWISSDERADRIEALLRDVQGDGSVSSTPCDYSDLMALRDSLLTETQIGMY
ncbi:MAG TPA: glycosyltransferase [Solirubrobacteraceae bacterium]|jgi:glycosyltransferase involved in cell wall biosynthesis|nr:glycosyltransferase [Solirubrobacteraceae bacterium]